MRGRPPVTRARVLTYWAKHGPCTIAQVCRATGAERSHVKRILRLACEMGAIAEPRWHTPGRPTFFCVPEFYPVFPGAIAA